MPKSRASKRTNANSAEANPWTVWRVAVGAVLAGAPIVVGQFAEQNKAEVGTSAAALGVVSGLLFLLGTFRYTVVAWIVSAVAFGSAFLVVLMFGTTSDAPAEEESDRPKAAGPVTPFEGPRAPQKTIGRNSFYDFFRTDTFLTVWYRGQKGETGAVVDIASEESDCEGVTISAARAVWVELPAYTERPQSVLLRVSLLDVDANQARIRVERITDGYVYDGGVC